MTCINSHTKEKKTRNSLRSSTITYICKAEPRCKVFHYISDESKNHLFSIHFSGLILVYLDLF